MNTKTENVVPFLNLLSDGNIGRLTQIATQLIASAAKHSATANIEALTRPGRPEPAPVSLNSRPSEMIGQSITNAISPAINKLAEVSKMKKISPTITKHAEVSKTENRGLMTDNYHSHTTYDKSFINGANSLIDIAEAFLGTSKPSTSPTHNQIMSRNQNVDWFPTIRQLTPGANSNFGIPKGEGCLPFLSEFMKMAYGNCVKIADEKAWDLWGNQINNALFGGKVDLIAATKETCKRGAERQYCGQLRKVISECDILGSLQVGMEMQRAIQRCDQFSGVIDQNPVHVLDQVNSIVSGEFAQGFLHKFLG
ncbi:unnamed protein product [Thelazia callipaeda]|uniref:Uncharacterized protein n=1 Tax=Thelazia callipaeda TaxID=103827 RepID=A0A0N5DBN0_THECL|nr:unnamed protein product [Thelazia callipaeda]